VSERVIGAPGALLVIISGPSGVGKDTIIQQLKALPADPPRHFVVTYKTRASRPGEVDGIDYHFISDADFRALEADGRLLEAAEVHGHWSGTPRDQVELALQAGQDAILKIDVQGAAEIKRKVPEALRIFVAPPSLEALSGRLRDRATETPTEFARRQRDAAYELSQQDDYDYTVVNETGQVERTAERIDRIIRREHELHRDRRISL
jgi:guanylate kinase